MSDEAHDNPHHRHVVFHSLLPITNQSPRIPRFSLSLLKAQSTSSHLLSHIHPTILYHSLSCNSCDLEEEFILFSHQSPSPQLINNGYGFCYYHLIAASINLYMPYICTLFISTSQLGLAIFILVIATHFFSLFS